MRLWPSTNTESSFNLIIIPWHTSVSNCEQWLRTWLCQSCTCEQFQVQEDRQGWGLSTESILIAAPEIERANVKPNVYVCYKFKII